MITTALIGAEGTGQLTAGFVIVFGVIELLSTTVLVAVFPMMSRAYADRMRAMFEFMIETLSFFTLVISLPIGIFTSLLAVPLAALLFGSEYTRTADVLRILIWYTVVTMVANVFAQALLIENRQRRTLAIRRGLAVAVALPCCRGSACRARRSPAWSRSASCWRCWCGRSRSRPAGGPM